MSTSTHCDVVVVGAGITGLTAAWTLARRGFTPLVLEASSRAGGLIRTEHASGFTIEAGPDSILASKPAGLALIDALGLSGSVQHLKPPGGAFVLRGTRLYRLPSPSRLGLPLTRKALARYTLLPWHARVRMALEPRVPPRRDTPDESIGSFFRRRFGPDTVDLIAQPLLGGIHAGDIEQLSMASLFPALLADETRRGHVLFGASAPATAPAREPAPPSGFVSLRGGMSTLVQALERALKPGTVRYHAAVERVERAADGWRVRVRPALADSADDAALAVCDAPAIILAVPAHVAARLLAEVDPDAARLCAEVPYVSTAGVALAWPRTAIAHPLHGTGFVVARRHSKVRITACTWVSSKWDNRAPEGRALLRAFIGGAHDRTAVTLPDDELIQIVCRDLGRVLRITGDPSLARVYRWPSAVAQHLVGHQARMDALDRRLAGLGGAFVAGSGFHAVGIPDCVADARRVAEAAIAAIGTPEHDYGRY